MNHAHPNENPPTLVYEMQTAQLLHEFDRIGTSWWDPHPGRHAMLGRSAPTQLPHQGPGRPRLRSNRTDTGRG